MHCPIFRHVSTDSVPMNVSSPPRIGSVAVAPRSIGSLIGLPALLLAALLVGVGAGSAFAAPPGAPPVRSGSDGTSGRPGVADRSRGLPPLPATDRGARLPLDQSGPLRWNGIRDAVTATVDAGRAPGAAPALEVRYERTRGTASGVAFVLPAGAMTDVSALELRMACAPSQRLFVCLTDASGAVWSFPAIGVDGHAEGGPELHTLTLSELAPDRWQNQGRTLPERPDPSSFVMLTLLDISGHMGGAEKPCAWRIESAELIGRTAAASAPKAAEGSAPAGTSTVREPGDVVPGGSSSERAADAEGSPSGGRAARREVHAHFFDALQRHPQRRASAIEALAAVVAADAQDARSTLLLGLGWLWTATDPALPADARASAIAKAVPILDGAAALAPDDDRIPTWQLSARYRLALLEGRRADADSARDRLRELTDRDPCFHALAFSMMAWDEPRDSRIFADAVGFARRAMRCGDEVSNGPRWPYGVQGFLVAASDLFSRVGDFGAAQEALVVAESMPGFDAWPHRGQVVDRLATLRDRIARFADTDPANDPAPMFASVSATACTGCHGKD